MLKEGFWEKDARRLGGGTGMGTGPGVSAGWDLSWGEDMVGGSVCMWLGELCCVLCCDGSGLSGDGDKLC